MMVGQISLNLSLCIYMFLYLPQIIHNQQQIDLTGLSKWMHLILYLAYFLDLLYGFGINLPWQYRVVSAVGLLLMTTQHLQFIRHFKYQKQKRPQTTFYSILICSSAILVWGISQKPFASVSLTYIGYISQSAFVLALIPQILKSKQLQSAQAINIVYIILNLLLATLDCISAWLLKWGWPNEIGASLTVLLTSVLLVQYCQYVKYVDNSTIPI